MRFYLPDWDDNVDAEYNFLYDENSELRKSERPLHFIWDIYGREEAPLDGILVSRDQIEDTNAKSERIRNHGIYGGLGGGMPNWLPTIVDCGAWGYRKLPRPPYTPKGIMEFYDEVGMTVGVTIDHLIIDSEPTSRLYLDERALPDGFDENDLPGKLGEDTHETDVMIAPWRTDETPETLDLSRFSTEDDLIDASESDPRLEYFRNDPQHRYELTLENAEQMWELYQENEGRPFRLMAAIQGWSADTYADAAERVIETGYNYIGIGGLAGASVGFVKEVVEAVGEVINRYQEEDERRIDAHIFGFAKNDAFGQIRRSGISSFDSASMLRASWTGGKNYHLGHERKYDAIRVHPSTPQRGFRESIDLELRGQPILQALRAYDQRDSIIEAMTAWRDEARTTLDALPDYLEENRHENRFDESSLTDVRQALRDDFEYGRELGSSFGNLRREIARLLREDSQDSPLAFEKYRDLIDTTEEVWEEWMPGPIPMAEQAAAIYGDDALFDQLMWLLREYVQDFDEESYLEEYSRTLRDRPWEECSCPICERMGIDVAIFRRNNRNRRRGFHNIHRFYREFTTEFPKTMIVTPVESSLLGYETVGDYLRNVRDTFWSATHDIPVAELGVLSADGLTEWWEAPPDSISVDPVAMEETLQTEASRYDHLLVHGELNEAVQQSVEASGCTVQTYETADDLRDTALGLVGKEVDTEPITDSTMGEL
ncbi:queuine tRNA-ribosyltransferase tRNA-guanine transglycosylase [Halobaculum sp. D14]|uniref:queuine tRNA-ribosyltransferase tRNA-guanine transglycosylase n=1 Tax=Halobaculum sp. D14 TaxID=3421642 RepID=UPI003EBCF5B6